MKKRGAKANRKLVLSRETLRHLREGLEEVAGGLPTTPIGTCPESDPAVCGGGGGGGSLLLCLQGGV